MALPKHEVMQGAHYAKQYATTYLEGDLSTRIIDYRNAWGGLTDAELPVPVKYLSHEPVALDKWPTVITVVLTTNNLERIGYAGGHNALHYAADPEYRVSYNMRTYIWCRAGNSEATTLQRDRLTTVVRSALLDYPSLKAQAGNLAIDQSKTFRAEIDESSMREEFSDLTPLKGERFLAGAYLGYELSLDEIVMRRAYAQVDEDGVSFGVKGVGLSQDTADGGILQPLVLPTNVAQGGASE